MKDKNTEEVQKSNANQNPENLKQCRFCQEKQQKIRDKLVRACECSGSIELIHQRCLKDHIQKKYGSYMPKRQIVCEICKQEIQIYKETSSRMRSFRQLREYLTTARIVYFLILVGIIFYQLMDEIIKLLNVDKRTFAIQRNHNEVKMGSKVFVGSSSIFSWFIVLFCVVGLVFHVKSILIVRSFAYRVREKTLKFLL